MSYALYGISVLYNSNKNWPSSDRRDDEQRHPAQLGLGCFQTCAKPDLQLSSTVEKRQDCWVRGSGEHLLTRQAPCTWYYILLVKESSCINTVVSYIELFLLLWYW